MNIEEDKYKEIEFLINEAYKDKDVSILKCMKIDLELFIDDIDGTKACFENLLEELEEKIEDMMKELDNFNKKLNEEEK